MMEELTAILTAEQKRKKNEVDETFIEWYDSIFSDYIHKAAIATVLFFVCYPWMAFFWPPYYFTDRRKE